MENIFGKMRYLTEDGQKDYNDNLDKLYVDIGVQLFDSIDINDKKALNTLLLGKYNSEKLNNLLMFIMKNNIRNNREGTIIIDSNGEFREKILEFSKKEGKTVYLFEADNENSLCINPLLGKEDDVIQLLSTMLLSSSTTCPYSYDISKCILEKSIKLLKMCYGDYCTLIDLNYFLENVDNRSIEIIKIFKKLNTYSMFDNEIKLRNYEMADWLLDNYFNNKQNGEFTLEMRCKLNKIVSNKFLNKMLIPQEGNRNRVLLNINEILNKDSIVIFNSSAPKTLGLSQYLNKFIGKYLELNLESDKKCTFYIKHIQTFSLNNLYKFLSTKRAKIVGAVSNLDLLGDSKGELLTRMNNIIIYNNITERDRLFFEYYYKIPL